jgi:hypothetical protein
MNTTSEQLVQLLQFALLQQIEIMATASEKGRGIQWFNQLPIMLPPLPAEECTENDCTVHVFAKFCDG